MKKLIINSICLFIAVISGVLLFVLKYQVKEQETILHQIHRQILRNKREIHMLEAEWAHLNDPQRLQELVAAQTSWQTIQAHQIVKISDLPMRSVEDSADFHEREKNELLSQEEAVHGDKEKKQSISTKQGKALEKVSIKDKKRNNR